MTIKLKIKREREGEREGGRLFIKEFRFGLAKQG